MKKFLNITVLIMLLVPMFMAPYIETVNAADNRTIRTILEDIEKQKKELEENKNKQTLTNTQITQIKNNIALIQSEITAGQNDIIELNNQIAELEDNIEKKDAEIKKVINFLEISSGESEYLEYIFGAKNFTDFIYRMAITEQLSDYNQKLIDEFNAMIEENRKKEEAIKAKEVELNTKQTELQKEIDKLKSQATILGKEQGNLEDGISKSESQVKALVADGCDMDETVDACYTRLKTLPSDTEFWRPLTYGTITSLWGSRSYYIGSTYYSDFHYGLDIGVGIGTPVYSVANGTVASKMWWDGTGYSLYIYHVINGVKYTSVYEHLKSYNVSVGQNVTKDTVVAYSGNTGQSSGPHLHVGLLTGWAGTEYSYWGSEYMSRLMDPKSKINFPGGYGSFSTRNRNCSLGAC